MALEEITTDIDIQTPGKKKKLVSMKKSSSYPFKSEAERIAYKKNMESIVKPGYGEMGYKERPASEMAEMFEEKPKAKPKAKIEVMKKAVLKQAAPLKPMIMTKPLDVEEQKFGVIKKKTESAKKD